jgi:hypothetical protein
MNLTKWLEALAASYPNYKITKLQIFEYKQELDTWIMKDEQWLQLKSAARRRHVFFPTIAELQEIMLEVRRGAAVFKPGSTPDFETWLGEDGKWYARRQQRIR